MEKGEEVYIRREKKYREDGYKYQKGYIKKEYRDYVQIEFKCKNGASYRESFYRSEIKKKEELEADASIY